MTPPPQTLPWRKCFTPPRKRRGVKNRVAASILTLALAATSCAPQPNIRRETTVFGTTAEITVAGGIPEQQAAKAIAQAFAHLQTMHQRFHPWQPGELATINKAIATNNLPITISKEMATMLTLSADHSRRGEYLFNPALGMLVSLWGFHADKKNKNKKPPDKAAIEKFAKNIPTLEAVKIKNGKLTAAHPQTRLDFGAIAKGAALDQTRGILKQNGVNNALINIGGNIIALGDNNGKPWRAALSAGKGKVFGAVPLKDGEALAVSGGGEQNYDYEGEKYHHIIDPRTARPAKNASLAAVITPPIANAGALSDSCATALVIATEKESQRILKNCQTTMALKIITTITTTTPAMSLRLTL